MHGLPEFALDRRALMRSAILLVGGVAAAGMPDVAFAQTAPAFFTAEERAVLDAYCGTMIPKTDTPGASEAGVPAFIDGMMTNWAANRTRRQFKTALTGIDAAATAAKGKGFAALSPAERLEVLTAHDLAQVGDPGYRRLKELTLTGYYLSEIGATQELRYELAPGVWEPKTAITPETRAWAVG
jgi:gluconate 2-dehydrogenase gamma chain